MDEESQFVRGVVESCARCGGADGPFAYMQDGRHYCVRCAAWLLRVVKMRPLGRREDDVTLEDLRRAA